MLSHDDKECELWLKSNGTLLLERQQYGHWIKASLFSLANRQVIEVKGYNLEPVKGMGDQSFRGGVGVSCGFDPQSAAPLLQGTQVDHMGLGKLGMLIDQPRNDSVTRKLAGVPSELPGTSNIPHNAADFESVIEELDRELADNVSPLNVLAVEVIQDIKRKEGEEVVLEVMQRSVELVRESEIVGHEIIPTNMQSSLGNVEFSMGWTEVSEKKLKVKSSHSKQASKGSTVAAREVGADLTKGNKKGTWTRLPYKPNNEQM